MLAKALLLNMKRSLGYDRQLQSACLSTIEFIICSSPRRNPKKETCFDESETPRRYGFFFFWFLYSLVPFFVYGGWQNRSSKQIEFERRKDGLEGADSPQKKSKGKYYKRGFCKPISFPKQVGNWVLLIFFSSRAFPILLLNFFFS